MKRDPKGHWCSVCRVRRARLKHTGGLCDECHREFDQWAVDGPPPERPVQTELLEE